MASILQMICHESTILKRQPGRHTNFCRRWRKFGMSLHTYRRTTESIMSVCITSGLGTALPITARNYREFQQFGQTSARVLMCSSSHRALGSLCLRVRRRNFPVQLRGETGEVWCVLPAVEKVGGVEGMIELYNVMKNMDRLDTEKLSPYKSQVQLNDIDLRARGQKF